MGTKKKNIVYFPQELIESHYIGPIKGTYIESTNNYNVVLDSVFEVMPALINLGEIYSSYEFCLAQHDHLITGYWERESLVFVKGTEKLDFKIYSLVQNIFSRNTGILESDMMKNKRAVVLGCGSVGSLVALELARAGIGNFLLIDNDIMEYHNICRHQCSITDVGDFKVEALKRRIHGINPFAQVQTQSTVIEQISKKILDQYCSSDESVIIGCADNRESDIYGNSIAALYNIPFISIGFWERAFAGEIFYQLPNLNMPCYECALGTGNNPMHKKDGNHRFYSHEENLELINFEPGISIDINFVTTIGIKLVIDILNRDDEKYTPRLLGKLKQYTLVCNTNDVNVGGVMAEIFSYPLQVTTSLTVSFNKTCPPCKYQR